MLSIGIVGLPNVGKSTLFKALTKKPVDISNYPFCTIEPNVGIVEVPDKRLDKLAEIVRPQKIVPAVIKFVDAAGLVKGAAKGEGLGNQFLAHLRETDLLLEVVRCFKNENIAHIDGSVDCQRDIKTIENELILKDLETVERRMEKIQKDLKSGQKQAQKEWPVLEAVKKQLEQGRRAGQRPELLHLFLLTAKPFLYLYNCPEKEVAQLPENGLLMDLRDELDKSELSQKELAELEMGLPKIGQLIAKCYNKLELLTFFTIAGGQQVQAWPIKKGSSVLQGAGMVHSDFQEKFVRAEAAGFESLVKAGSWKRAAVDGIIQTKGRDYILEDSDVIEIKI